MSSISVTLADADLTLTGVPASWEVVRGILSRIATDKSQLHGITRRTNVLSSLNVFPERVTTDI